MLFEGSYLSCSILDNDVVELCFDTSEDSANILHQKALQELAAAIEKIQNQPDLKGLMFTSAKDTFILGADIREFLGIFTVEEEVLFSFLDQAHQILNSIEDLPFPTITVINGMALGGGCELALSTDFRIMSPDARIGLPEVKLGIFPGFGGSVRLPRLIGNDSALEWIATGDHQKADAALKVGAVDAVVSKDKLKEAAMSMLVDSFQNKLDWKRNRTLKTSPLSLNQVEATMSFETAKGYILSKAGPNYPAPIAAVKAIQAGATFSRDEAIKEEAKAFIKVAKTDVAGNLIGLFLSDQGVKKISKKYQEKANQIKNAAVIGAGIMGGGIAYQSASKGIPIVMKDIQNEALALGMNEAGKLLSKQVDRGKINPQKMSKVLATIRPTLSYEELNGADIVIEAVVENPKIKKQVLQELEEKTGDNTILATNTSTISVSDLAESLKQPEKFCGMHFFNPVHRMPLVEVIRGRQTSEETIAATVSYAVSMGKTPIVVNDCPGFLVNRVLFPYFMGFFKLLDEGVDFVRIDKIMEKFGWPMGPAYLNDVVGLDTAHHALDVMAAGFPDRMKSNQKSMLDLLYENKRFGQKNGKGFYRYEIDKKGKPKKLYDEEVAQLFQKHVKASKDVSDEEIIDRIMIPMIFEAARCLEENIVEKAFILDIGLIYGLGFPPFRGGLLKYADSMSISTLLEKSVTYSHLGNIYQPNDLLKNMASEKKTFY